jgi:hypothetical protein
VVVFNTDQVTGVCEVNVREYFATVDTIVDLVNDLEQVAIPNRDFVNSAIVNA